MIKLSGTRDEPDSNIVYGLQTIVILTRQTRKHRIAVIELRENKACYEHCTCTTGQTAPNATDLPLDTLPCCAQIRGKIFSIGTLAGQYSKSSNPFLVFTLSILGVVLSNRFQSKIP